jgi:hypothetical protein
MPVIPSTREAEAGGSLSKAGPRQKRKTLSEKYTKAKKSGGVAQVVEYKCEFNPQ